MGRVSGRGPPGRRPDLTRGNQEREKGRAKRPAFFIAGRYDTILLFNCIVFMLATNFHVPRMVPVKLYPPVPGDVRFLRIAEVCRMAGLSRSEIYKRVQAGRFPRPVKLAPKVAAWSSATIRQWQIEQELIG